MISEDMQAMHNRDKLAQFFGIQLHEVRSGFAVLSMRVVENMLNGHDICHGGVIFSLADTAFAHACNSGQPLTLAQSCDVDFLKPVKKDDLLFAEAREVSRSKRSGIYDVSVRQDDGPVIAMFRGRSRVAPVTGTESKK